MTAKRIISYTLIFILIFGIASAAAVTAGSASDPLISKSYIDSTYPDIVLKAPRDYLSTSMTVLKYKLSQSGPSAGKGVSVASAVNGGSISMSAGSSFILLSGLAKLSSCTGTLIDVTDGSTVSVGASLAQNHRFVACENTMAAASVISDAIIAVYGGVSVNSGASSSFTDISKDAWYYGDVCYAVQKGLVNGKTVAAYAPDDNLSIAEAIKLASCIYQLYHYGTITLTNDSTLWYKSYVEYAAQNSIVTKTYSNYDARISRSEFVAIFYAALPASEYTAINTVSDNSIPDVRVSDANASQIYAFYRAGILTGSDSSGTFYSNSNIKRSEVAAILTRMFESSYRKTISLS